MLLGKQVCCGFWSFSEKQFYMKLLSNIILIDAHHEIKMLANKFNRFNQLLVFENYFSVTKNKFLCRSSIKPD